MITPLIRARVVATTFSAVQHEHSWAQPELTTCAVAMTSASLSRAYKRCRVHVQQSLLPLYQPGKHSIAFLTCIWRMVCSRRTLLCFPVGIIIWIYIVLLSRHGSISPVATSLYTTPYPGRSALDYPPSTWRPSFRVVVSLTTTPNRLNKVMDSVESLLRQSLLPDQIYVNVPEGPMKRHPSRSYDETPIPAALQGLAPLVRVNRCHDDGPATKLIGALRHEHDPDTLVITVDDDFEYPHKLVEALAWEAEYRPQDAIGVCGWGIMPLPWHPVGAVPAYVPYFMRPTGRYVDILQACCGNAYRRGFFSDVDDLADIPPVCVTVDDVWIAGYLRTAENRRIAVISKQLDPEDPSWKDEEAKSDAGKQMKLSEYNHANRVHHKCIQAIEDRFRRRWVRNYEEAMARTQRKHLK
ncbi:hypothetical protein Poli38472_012663 [Pythium oligandrum]|uniref:Uncharacterized protein n=1 Tax=Pythium oligandrum TaxID=41045 RepID=A0A8K1FJ64_PYTOL|nr:hypothetical protein Poli38472_012663 [Pythium oligandrum]|eukprot:TMW61472.1 hypothetical protein Poli38472_012663 [Pythium oligandrum]